MAIHCSEECKEMGALCDFCIHYVDAAKGNGFAGEGYCKVLNKPVDAFDYCEEHFHCVLVKED